MADLGFELTDVLLSDEFSLDQTFSCGQCFRWERLGTECWRGTAFGKTVTLQKEGDLLKASCSPSEFASVWKPYLDLDTDYRAIRDAVSVDAYTAQCVKDGAGIRILRQDPWETLVSFILSQCNHIPRIRGIIQRLCERFGEPIGDGSFTFPDAQKLAVLCAEDLAPLRCGYRAPYLLSAAQAIACGAPDLDEMKKQDTQTARSTLLVLPGVGIKVASCILLFGFHRLEVFPVDTWIQKALRAHYGPDFDPSAAFGAYAGAAQQYIFYKARGKFFG